MALSRAITLIESTRADHREQASALLDRVAELRGQQRVHTSDGCGTSDTSDTSGTNGTGGGEGDVSRTFRLGIAGPPGAGKSTFIEALGEYITSAAGGGHRLAVIAVDPSSSVTGGSILGDKTRMTELSRNENAFVRPCPSRGALGGVAQHTNEVVLLCEAGGYDIVVVESVGLGQSEVSIDDTVDMLMLLTPPAAGDELQGVKKGIMELVDIVVVNKADGDLLGPANHAATELMHSLQLLRRKSEHWKPAVKTCSALEKRHIDDVWEEVMEYRATMENVGALSRKRQQQGVSWAWGELQHALMEHARADKRARAAFDVVEEKLGHGHITPRRAAQVVMAAILDGADATGSSSNPDNQ